MRAGWAAVAVACGVLAAAGCGGSPDSEDATAPVVSAPPQVASAPLSRGGGFDVNGLVATGRAAGWAALDPAQRRAVANRWIAIGRWDVSSRDVVSAVDSASPHSDESMRDFITRAVRNDLGRIENEREVEEKRAKQAAARAQAARKRAAARERARQRGILVEGIGSRVVTVSLANDGPVVVEASHRGGSNFIIRLVGNGLDSLLVNEIGAYSGTWVEPEVLSGRYRFVVDADGPWSVRYRQPVPARGAPSILRTFTGNGPKVLPIQSPDDVEPVITGRNSGDSNFIVSLIAYGGAVTGRELLFNDIGPYSGQTLTSIPAGDYLLSVDAEGSWTVRFQR